MYYATCFNYLDKHGWIKVVALIWELGHREVKFLDLQLVQPGTEFFRIEGENIGIRIPHVSPNTDLYRFFQSLLGEKLPRNVRWVRNQWEKERVCEDVVSLISHGKLPPEVLKDIMDYYRSLNKCDRANFWIAPSKLEKALAGAKVFPILNGILYEQCSTWSQDNNSFKVSVDGGPDKEYSIKSGMLWLFPPRPVSALDKLDKRIWKA